MTPLLLSFAEARARVLRAARPLPAETVALEHARGRALRQRVVATYPLPPFDNSAMDGYAVRAQDLAGASLDHAIELPVAAVAPAGPLGVRRLEPGSAGRIMTGAWVPEGADAIVPFEDCVRLDGAAERARFATPVTPGAHIRRAGADLAAGDRGRDPGHQLSAHDVALLAALGCARLAAGPKPPVAVVSTGDELRDVWASLAP